MYGITVYWRDKCTSFPSLGATRNVVQRCVLNLVGFVYARVRAYIGGWLQEDEEIHSMEEVKAKDNMRTYEGTCVHGRTTRGTTYYPAESV